MNIEQLQKLINEGRVKVGEKGNKISYNDGYFVVEFFEFTSDKDGDMYSMGPDFVNIEDAIQIAVTYTSESYTYKKWGKR